MSFKEFLNESKDGDKIRKILNLADIDFKNSKYGDIEVNPKHRKELFKVLNAEDKIDKRTFKSDGETFVILVPLGFSSQKAIIIKKDGK